MTQSLARDGLCWVNDPTEPARSSITLVLNNSEIHELLPMQDCLQRLNEAYREMGQAQAGNRPRSDIYGPVHDSRAPDITATSFSCMMAMTSKCETHTGGGRCNRSNSR